jgi:uncharacterized protein (TIGR02145 family)
MKKNTINSKVIFIIMLLIIVATACKKENNNNDDDSIPPPVLTVTDVDGNVYQTVTIGTQVWMQENLRVTHYRNGDAIEQVTDSTAWYQLGTGAYCNYKNASSFSGTYGRLYNWFAVNDSRNICPVGWHIPTVAEWEVLIAYLGDSNSAGGKMKEAGTVRWYSPNTGADNSSGFTALPAGFRSANSLFGQMYMSTLWWSSTETNAILAECRMVLYNSSGINRPKIYKQVGCSVRCIKD